jgi:Cdc6-like AAA superfamily ATPase
MKISDLFKKKKESPNIELDDPIEECTDEELLPDDDILDLGWYWSETKQEMQMAKISEKDRSTHFYIVGASGTGKSKFLEFLIREDIKKSNGFGVIDPHGDLVEDLKGYLIISYSPQELEEKVLFIDPVDKKYTVFFNPLENIKGVSAAEISAELVEVFKKIWRDSWGARMEDLIRNTFIALIESGLTLVELPRFLINEDFRLNVLEKVSHPITLQYFQRFNTLTPKTRDEWIESTLNKVNAFLSDDRIREMLSSTHSSFLLREIMDNKKILLLKLDKGKLKENADLVGSLFLTKIKMAAFSRSDIPKEERVPFYLYLDEFQNFATQAFIETLSEARKYRFSLVMAHQNLSQLPEDLQDSVLANCGIQVCFRVSRKDAETLAKESFMTTGTEVKSYKLSWDIIDYDFYSYPEEWEKYFQELQNLPNRHFYAKHKIEGGVVLLQTVDVFSAYEEFGITKEEYCELLEKSQFGKKYLRERRPVEEKLELEEEPKREEKAKESEEQKTVGVKEERPRTLEEIIASMTPLEKAILYAIGTGNYTASDIFEQGNKELKKIGASTRKYAEFKKKFYELSKKPSEGKGLVEFVKRGRSFCYWLSEWGEIAFAEKFNMPSDRAINELGGGGKLSRSVCLEIIKEWLEPEGYKIRKEDLVDTDLNLSKRGYTDLVAEKEGEELRIEIEHRSPKEQVEKNIRKNLEISDVLYIITSDEITKRKVIQVTLRVMFRLRKEKPDKELTIRIGSIDEQKKNRFKEWFELKNL